MTIVCLGWGSLIWNPRELPVSSDWRTDGPSLPLEFARQSNDGRITLVVTSGAASVPVYWAGLDFLSVDEAKLGLAKREGIPERLVHRSVGFWSPDAASDHREAARIGEWAHEHGHRGVVWTALKPKFGNDYVTPRAEQVLEYLESLTGEPQRLAEEYIRKAPKQIVTSYRQDIERTLGWTPLTDE